MFRFNGGFLMGGLVSFLIAGAVTTASAQLVTITGSVNFGSGVFSSVPVGDVVTVSQEITSKGKLSAGYPLGWNQYVYESKVTISDNTLGTLLLEVPGTFIVEDFPTFSGVADFSDSLHYIDQMTSRSRSVLTPDGTFLSPSVAAEDFDLVLGGIFNLGVDGLFAWNIDKITVSAATPVPESSTFGLIGAASLIGLALYRRRR